MQIVLYKIEQVILRNVSVNTYAYIHVIKINEKRDNEFEISKKIYMRRFGGRKEKEKCNYHIIILKTTKRKKAKLCHPTTKVDIFP